MRYLEQKNVAVVVAMSLFGVIPAGCGGMDLTVPMAQIDSGTEGGFEGQEPGWGTATPEQAAEAGDLTEVANETVEDLAEGTDDRVEPGDTGNQGSDGTVLSEEELAELLRQAFLAGYQAGFREGFEEGFLEGYNKGYQDGYEDGHADGYAEGYAAAYEVAYAEGFDTGYDSGYNDGVQETQSVFDEGFMATLCGF